MPSLPTAVPVSTVHRLDRDTSGTGPRIDGGRRALVLGALAGAAFPAPALALPSPDKVVAAYYPPLMIDDTERPGLSIEILQRAADRLGRELEITFMPYARALKTLRRRENHLLPALLRNPDHETDYTWVARTHTVRDVFNTIDTPINTLEQARQRTLIGVESNAAMDVMLTRLGFTNLVRTSSPIMSTQQLRSGRIGAWALTRSVSRWIWNELGHPEDLLQGTPVAIADVYVAASSRVSRALASDYTQAILSLHVDGSVKSIVRRYHGR
jgi:polar amino acid transport system substrate-binding protein